MDQSDRPIGGLQVLKLVSSAKKNGRDLARRLGLLLGSRISRVLRSRDENPRDGGQKMIMDHHQQAEWRRSASIYKRTLLLIRTRGD